MHEVALVRWRRQNMEKAIIRGPSYIIGHKYKLMFKKTNLLILDESGIIVWRTVTTGCKYSCCIVWKRVPHSNSLGNPHHLWGQEYHNSSQQTVMTSRSLSQVAFKDFPSFSQSKSISILRSSFIFFIVIITIWSYLFIHLFVIYLPLKWEWQDNSEFTWF